MKKAPKVLTRMRLSCCWGDNLDEKELNEVVDYIDDLEQQVKKQKEVINKVMNVLKDNFVYEYVRSCDTSDGIGHNEVDTDHFTYLAYEKLKEVSK